MGSDTAGTTTEWEMAELLHNPKLLKKAQQELDQVIGKGRQVEESNFDKLPYLSVNCEKKNPKTPPSRTTFITLCCKK